MIIPNFILTRILTNQCPNKTIDLSCAHLEKRGHSILLKRIFADGVLLMVTFVWGVTFVLVQDAIQSMPVFSFLAIRFLISGMLLFLPVLVIPSLRRTLANVKMWIVGGVLGFWLFVGYAFQTLGLLYTSPGKAGFITGLYVILVPVFSIFILRHMPTRFAWLGVALAAVGLFFLTFDHTGHLNLGDVFEFFCAISFALQIVYVGKHTQQFAALPMTAIQITLVGLLSLITGAATHVNFTSSLHALTNWTVINALWICILLATVLAYLAQMVFQKFTTATRTALVFSMEPVFAALSAFIMIHEIMTPLAMVGSGLILVGMVVAELGGQEKVLQQTV